jgi:uncharacterized protein
MQFMVLAYDGTDDGALERRLRARPAHLAGAEKMAADGRLVYAAAVLDDADQMMGSLMILDVVSRDDIDRWLEYEPYVVGEVWKDITVTPCSTAPLFTS